MRFEHRTEDGYFIVFEDERDYLRCKLSYVFECDSPAFSMDFGEYVAQRRYNIDRISVVDIEYIGNSNPISETVYVNATGNTAYAVGYNTQVNGYWSTTESPAYRTSTIQDLRRYEQSASRVDEAISMLSEPIVSPQIPEEIAKQDEEPLDKKAKKPKGTIFDKIDLD